MSDPTRGHALSTFARTIIMLVLLCAFDASTGVASAADYSKGTVDGRLAAEPISLDKDRLRQGLQDHRCQDRGIVSFMGKAPLPADVWLEVRARTDLRWIGGDHSTRYRLRLEATRVFTAGGHTVVPHASAEWFYDTRYDGWARTLYKLEPEVTVNEHFR